MARNVPGLHAGGLFVPNFLFESRSRMFGLIIAIDKYKYHKIRDLRGCKGDAQSIINLLSHKFHIRPHQWHCLVDESTTRSAIIKGFQHRLLDNSDIEHGDAIAIYYASHGHSTTPIRPHNDQTIDDDGK